MKAGDIVTLKVKKKSYRFIVLQKPEPRMSGDMIVRTRALGVQPFGKGANVQIPIDMLEVSDGDR
jgi:hypothetical protein